MIRLAGPGTSQSHFDLVTLAEFKAFAEVTTSSQDALMQSLLDNTHRAWHTFVCGRFVKDTGVDYDELLDGPGMDRLSLPTYPIVSISLLEEVRVRGNDVFDTVKAYAATDYQIDKASGILYATTFFGWPYGWNTLRVKYRAGFATTPADVRQAICEWASVRLRRVKDARHDHLSITHEADNVVFTRDDMPQSVEKVAVNYRTVEMTLG